MTRRFGRMSDQSTMARGATRWAGSWLASPVPRCPSPAGEKAPATSAGSGPRYGAPIAKLARDGSSLKTCQGYLPLMTETPSTPSSPTWPKAGCLRNGSIFRRPTWAPPTSATASGCWPTAQTRDGDCVDQPGCRRDGPPGHLSVAAEAMWPTVRADDQKGSQGGVAARAYAEAGMKRPKSRNGKTRGGRGKTFDTSLSTVVEAMWPTATAANATAGRTEESRERNHTGTTLVDVVGMWPTPVANDDNKTPEAHLAMKQRMGERDGTGANRTAITSLNVFTQSWPTPNATDTKGASQPEGRRPPCDDDLPSAVERLWSTLRATDGDKGGPNMAFGAGGTPLPTASAAASEGWGQTPTGLWPTPCAEEATGHMSGSNRDTWRPTLSGLARGQQPVLHQGRPGPSSPPAPPGASGGPPSSRTPPGSRRRSARRRLNVYFVEWLQGLPPNWTSPTASIDSAHWATWLSLCVQRLRSLCSTKD